MHKYSIKEHEQGHIDLDSEKFKCEQCSRVFSRDYELRKHIKKHQDASNNIVENHQCDKCDKRNMKSESLVIM